MPVPTQNNFASILESRANEPQDFICFLDAESGQTCTYFDLRLRGVWLARELEAQNVVRGGVCAVDMANTPELLYTIAAAAYGGFTLLLLNNNLSDAEKKRRVADVKQAMRVKHLPVLSESTARALIAEADTAGPNARNVLAQWARRGVGAFDENAMAFVMLKAGVAGRQKAVPITWAHLLAEARAFNATLCTEGQGIWQLVLPLFHMDGLQIFFRSVLNHNAMVFYRSFNAPRVLSDAFTYSATHLALGDKMLQDLLDLNEEVIEKTGKSPLELYECILVDAAHPNKQTLIRALGQHISLFMAFGHTEPCSYFAAARLADSECIELEIFDGYTTTIVAPDATGFGQLGVTGPSVVTEYLNARAAVTADGMLLTGSTVRATEQGTLVFAEPVNDNFDSGGETIVPEDIRNKIMAFEGVTDAYVFGATDDVWGYRPVAFVEAGDAASRPGFNRFYAADDMRNRLSTRLDKPYLPDQFVFMNEFPRTSVGKVGVGTLERMWEGRLQPARVEIWHIRLPLVAPIRTAKTRLRNRDSIVVRITDYAGHHGIGECVAFETDWYTPETIATDLPLIRDALAPLLVGRVLLHPSEVTELFENAPGAMEAPLARAALENALWDLYGKVRGRAITQLIGARESIAEEGALDAVPEGCVLGGAVVGLGPVAEVLASVDEAVEAGYRRVKLKIKPGEDVDLVRAVRNAHPELMIMLDADQSYKDEQLSVLQELDEFNIESIEEPLDPTYTPTVGPTDLFDRLARLQSQLRMRVCLDESWTNGEELREILDAHPELRCVSLKIGKFGGVTAALDFHKWARERGIEAWPGGMYETGISKRLHAAFGLLPGVNLPGDINDSSRYFTVDICLPPFELSGGLMVVNNTDHPTGLGCSLNESVLANVTEGYWLYE